MSKLMDEIQRQKNESTNIIQEENTSKLKIIDEKKKSKFKIAINKKVLIAAIGLVLLITVALVIINSNNVIKSYNKNLEAGYKHNLRDEITLNDKYTEGWILVSSNTEPETIDEKYIGKVKYTFTLSNGKKDIKQTVVFNYVDKTAPTIKLVNEDFYLDDELDYSNKLEITDKVDGDIDISKAKISGNIDMKKEGRYNIIVVVKDKSGNEATETFDVKVIEPIFSYDEFIEKIVRDNVTPRDGDYGFYKVSDETKVNYNYNFKMSDMSLEEFGYIDFVKGELYIQSDDKIKLSSGTSHTTNTYECKINAKGDVVSCHETIFWKDYGSLILNMYGNRMIEKNYSLANGDDLSKPQGVMDEFKKQINDEDGKLGIYNVSQSDWDNKKIDLRKIYNN